MERATIIRGALRCGSPGGIIKGGVSELWPRRPRVSYNMEENPVTRA